MASSDALSNGRKRSRDEDFDEGAGPSVQLVASKAKDLYLAMKAACSAKRYSEAVNICSEALHEENLPKSSRIQFLLARSSIYSKMDDSFPLAIKDAKQAILLSPTHAMSYLRAAKAFHQEGHRGKAVQALAKAASLATDTMSDLSSYIRDLQREWSVPHIQAVAPETLAHIFSYLDVKGLVACTSTCRRWRDVSMSNPSIWRKPIVLRGSIKQIDAKWKAFYKLTRGGQVSSLTLDLSQDTKATSNDLLKAWQLSTLRKTFPSTSLVEFDYSGRDYAMDEQVWSCVTACTKLKVLRWKSNKLTRRVDEQDGRNLVRCQIKGTPLADCRLDEFRYDDASTVVIDVAFTQIFSQVKRLYLLMYLPFVRQHQILKVARSTVQEVYITGTVLDDSEFAELEPLNQEDEEAANLAEEVPTPIEMTQVTLFGTLWSHERDDGLIINGPARYALSLPKITKAIIKGGLLAWPELELFQQTLVHLDYDFGDYYLHDDIERSKYRLPSCESLVLTFSTDIFLAAFWKATRAQDEAVRILPNLKHLKIAGHPSLKGSELVNFVRFRATVGPPIQTLHIYQCEQVDYESVAWLRRTVPDFIYSSSTTGRQFLQDL